MRSSPIRPLTGEMRLLLLVASGLVFTVGIPLLLLTEQTDRYFAWTIPNQLTASFLGAAYWSSFALELLAARERAWARARIAVPAVLLFTMLTLIVTLIHLGSFHLNSPSFITRLGTWAWLAVYAIVPVAMAVLLVRQLRLPGGDPPRLALLPGWIRLVLAINAALLLLLGAGLLIVPDLAAGLWPWQLSALGGRAIGAWLLGLGLAAAHANWENDLSRLRPLVAGAAIFSILQLLNLARYPGVANWSGPAIWVYLLLLLSMLTASLAGWRASQRLPGA